MGPYKVEAIHVCIDPGKPMKPQGEALLLPNFGMQGDARAAPNNSRQVLLSRLDVLRKLNLAPGGIGDHITTSGLPIDYLPTGTKLDVGEAVVAITDSFAPGDEFDRIRSGLKNALSGRGAVWVAVVKGGYVRPGDKVALHPD